MARFGLSRTPGAFQYDQAPNQHHFLLKIGPQERYIAVVLVRRCPRNPEDSAERYWLRRLSPHPSIRVKRHCKVGRRCAAVLAREREVVALMRAAGVALRRQRALCRR